MLPDFVQPRVDGCLLASRPNACTLTLDDRHLERASDFKPVPAYPRRGCGVPRDRPDKALPHRGTILSGFRVHKSGRLSNNDDWYRVGVLRVKKNDSFSLRVCPAGKRQ